MGKGFCTLDQAGKLTLNILLTGSSGYIGSKFVDLFSDDYQIRGLDTNFFNTGKSESKISKLNKDIRDIDESDIKGIDIVVHMAELSNDPLGQFSSSLTKSINIEGTKKLVNIAKNSDIKKFVYMSSCSVYGQNENIVNENSPTNPLTNYAKAKVENEELLLNNEFPFEVKILRNATAFGYSSNHRLDLVINDLTYNALLNNQIKLLSDGTPRRPVVHIADICNIIKLLIEQNSDEKILINVGSSKLNYSVKEMALKISHLTKVRSLTFGSEDKDQRSYNVSFDKFEKLFPKYEFLFDLERGVSDLIKNDKFYKKTTSSIRVKKLLKLLEENQLDESLYWTKSNG